MTTEQNEALVRRPIDDVFLGSRPDAVDELVAEDFTPHTWASVGAGRDDLKRAIERVSAGLSDASWPEWGRPRVWRNW